MTDKMTSESDSVVIRRASQDESGNNRITRLMKVTKATGLSCEEMKEV